MDSDPISLISALIEAGNVVSAIALIVARTTEEGS